MNTLAEIRQSPEQSSKAALAATTKSRRSGKVNSSLALLPPTAGWKRILAPVDFSGMSIHSLQYAARLAAEHEASICLVCVLEKPSFVNDLLNQPLVLTDDELAKKAHFELAKIAKKVVSEGIPVFPHVRIGKPWEEIVALADHLKADLIVMPTHGRKGLKHVALGSTAERVIRSASCPVLVVKETSSPKER